MAGLLAAVGVVAIAIAQARTPRARRTTAATVELRETSLGKILANSAGLTLFEFTKDKKKHDSCASISGCPEVWPALEVSGMPTAGAGLKQSLLGTIKLTGGGEQVTYAGRALYLYSAQHNPGETSYVGVKEFGGTWYALNAKGRPVKPSRHSGGGSGGSGGGGGW